jgi:hypothetical protein
MRVGSVRTGSGGVELLVYMTQVGVIDFLTEKSFFPQLLPANLRESTKQVTWPDKNISVKMKSSDVGKKRIGQVLSGSYPGRRKQ